MSIFCVGGGEFFRYAQNPPPPTQNIVTRAVTDKINKTYLLTVHGKLITIIKNISQNSYPKSKIYSYKKKSYKLNKKKIRKRIYSYTNLEQTKKRLYFITVTFPFKTTDNQAYKLFNLWLTKLRKKDIIKSYIWVVERQKNNTIHFHLLINQYFKVKKANFAMKESLINMYNKDKKVFNGYNPLNYNGIDIAKNRKTKKVTNFARANKGKTLQKYITKYISKNETEFNRLTWHCSRDISKLFYAVRDDFDRNIYNLMLRNKKNWFYKGEYFEVLVFHKSYICDKILKLFEVNQLIYDSF